MSYLVLARKWRPRSFDEVVGQRTVVQTLRNALASGRIGHAFLFSGARGVGKTTTARILARALNCSRDDNPTPEPCGSCPSCLEIAAGTSLDVQEIDGATHNGVEQVRELRESARYNPARDRFKIWIIDEVHMLSTGAFNALLKTLEEPPPRVKFIFATTEYHKIPDTILSRCQQYDFRLIPTKEIAAHLRKVADGESIRISDDAVGRIARAAEGSARDALSLLDQVLSFSDDEVRDEDIQALLGLIDRELLLRASRAAVACDTLALLELVEDLSDYGVDLRNFARELLLHLREILLVKLAPEDSRLLAQLGPDERERLLPLASELSEEDLLRFTDVMVRSESELRWAQDPRVTLELALLKLAQLRRLMPLAELVQRLEALEGGETPPARAVRPAPSAPVERGASRTRVATPERAASTRRARAIAEQEEEDEPADDDASLGASGSVPARETSLIERIMALASSRPSLVQPLRTAKAELTGNTLRLVVASDFRAFAEMHLDEYKDLARRALGHPVSLALEAVASEGKPKAPPSQDEVRRRELIERAQQEPAVQQALEMFEGRIADVREDDASRKG